MADASRADGADVIRADARNVQKQAESTIARLLVFVDKLSQLKRVTFADVESSKSTKQDDELIAQLRLATKAPARIAIAQGSLEALATEASDAIRFGSEAAGADEDGSELVKRVQVQLLKRVRAETPKLKSDPFGVQYASQLNARATTFQSRVEAKRGREARAASGEEPDDDDDDEEPVDITVFDSKKSLTCGLTGTLFVDPILNDADGGCTHVYSRKGISQMMAHKPSIECPFPGCVKLWVSGKYKPDVSTAARVALYGRIEDAVKLIESDDGVNLTMGSPSLASLGRASAAGSGRAQPSSDDDDDDDDDGAVTASSRRRAAGAAAAGRRSRR